MGRMVRKQVFITPEQWGRLKAHAAAAGVSMAEIIRRGIERELEQPLPSAIEGDWKDAWRPAFGMWADRDDLDGCTPAYAHAGENDVKERGS